jgi:twinkle protein
VKTFADFNIILPPGASGNVKTICPECSHGRSRQHVREKCLSVNVEDGIWLCHHCQWSGALPKDRPTPIRPTVRVEVPPVTPIPPAFSQIGERGLGWFAARGISEQTVQAFGIYSEKRYFPGAEKELHALCFPYQVNGALVNVKYRSAVEGKHFTMVKGARKTFYNLDAVRDEQKIVIVEGEMDVLACAVAGVKAISVPNGANSLTDEVMDSARFLLDRADTQFVLAGDMDEAGYRLTEELARRFGRERCAVVAWPGECKDANDVLKERGADALRTAIEAAAPFPVAGLITVAEEEQATWGIYADGPTPALTTGWRALDGFYSVRPGQVTVVTGEPGAGKSAWMDNLAVNMANTHDWRIGIYSPENQPIARHIGTLAAKYVGAPFFDGVTPRMGPEELDAAIHWLKRHVSFILPEEPTVEAVLDLARILVYRAGITGLIIDPWNEMDHSRPAALSETEYISRCLTRIRTFARNNGVHVWLVAHPTKLIKGADGQYPAPTPYDISGSAHWFNKADNCISLRRNKLDAGAPTEVHIQKIRFAEVGRIGTAELHYDPPTGSFHDLAPPIAPAWRGGEA